MPAASELDVNIVRKLHPFDSISIGKVKEILKKSAVQNLPADRILFKRGDRDKWIIYLLSGSIELTQSDGTQQLIEGGTEIAQSSISNNTPRIATARSQTDISILIIDRELLQLLLNHDDGGIEVGGIDEDDEDWMTRFLQSNAFLQLPAANIPALMMRLREESLTAGSVVIKENSPNDDMFYIIQEGSCLVTKTNQSTGTEITLAQLDYGAGFGEEALITGGVRGASVTMETDGIMMMLEKKDFLELLVEPLIHRVQHEELEEFLSSEKSLLIDVRSEEESRHQQLDNSSHNFPINLLRSQLEQLDDEKHYIVYSNHENRSSAAAFLFIQHGLDSSILADGVGDIETTESVKSSTNEESSTNKESSTTEDLIIEIPSDVIAETDKLNPEQSLSEQLLIAHNKYKKLEAFATEIKVKAQEAIKFAKLKSKQLELSKQQLKTETQRADQAETELKLAREEIEQLT